MPAPVTPVCSRSAPARLLARADVIVHDRLTTAAMLDLAPTDAVRIDVGKSAGHATMAQAAINATLVEHGRRHRVVVRLKGGDPFVFGRGGEEAQALIDAGVAFEVVPGVSSALAAPAVAGVPVTMRNQALAFTVLTGHEDPAGTSTVDWEAHAATGATLVIVMGVGRIATIAKRLIVGGLRPETPVVAVRWATTAAQDIQRSTLDEVAQLELAAPCTIIVGEVAGLDLRSVAATAERMWLPSDVTVPASGDHGGDARRIAVAMGHRVDELVDLSASMNPFAPDVEHLAVRAITGPDRVLLDYPDAGPATAHLAHAIGVDPRRLVLTNGAAEAIALVAAELGAGWVEQPEFSLYARHLARLDRAAPRWRSNPSNPLGVLAAPSDAAGVWDESFLPLATGAWTRGDDAAWRIGSLTKLWHGPGLRLGYVIAPDVDSAERIRRRQPAWAVNGLALALVAPLLARTDLPAWREAIVELRTSFVAELRSIGVTVTDTSAPWVLVERDRLRDDLARLGVVVRDCSSFGLPGTSRVAVPRPADVARVVDAFARAQSDAGRRSR